VSPSHPPAATGPQLETKFAVKKYGPLADVLKYLLWTSAAFFILLLALLAVIAFVTVYFNEFNEPRKKRFK
jgi:ABC-type transport system involved in cytochrome c biogenesis permease subunit